MKQITRVSVAQQIADTLDEYIKTSEIEVGQKMPTEQELCKQYGVSRGTVREAFCLLQSSGLVELRPGRGAFVANKQDATSDIEEWFKHNNTKMWDIVEMRLAIEPLAARMMAERCTDENIAHLLRIHNRFLKAAESGAKEEAAHNDARFHAYIVEKSGNELMRVFSKHLNNAVELYCQKTYLLPGHMIEAVDPHIEIANAIQARNPEESERAMRAHLGRINTTLKDSFMQFGNAPVLAQSEESVGQ